MVFFFFRGEVPGRRGEITTKSTWSDGSMLKSNPMTWVHDVGDSLVVFDVTMQFS